jgi:hypothetical protein
MAWLNSAGLWLDVKHTKRDAASPTQRNASTSADPYEPLAESLSSGGDRTKTNCGRGITVD